MVIESCITELTVPAATLSSLFGAAGVKGLTHKQLSHTSPPRLLLLDKGSNKQPSSFKVCLISVEMLHLYMLVNIKLCNFQIVPKLLQTMKL